jgi:hypothetical protein
MLFKMTNPVVPWNRYFSGVGLFLTKNEFEKSSFAVTVTPDQAQTLPGVHL